MMFLSQNLVSANLASSVTFIYFILFYFRNSWNAVNGDPSWAGNINDIIVKHEEKF